MVMLLEVVDFAQDVVGAFPHRPEFVQRELPAVEPLAGLLEEDRAGRGDLDEDRGQDQQGTQDEESQSGGCQVEDPLDEQLPFLGPRRLEMEERKPVELGDRGSRELRVEEIDGDRHDDALGLAVLDRPVERVQPRSRDDEDDLVHGFFVEDPGDVLERADDGQPVDLADPPGRLVVDGPQELEAPLGVAVDLADELDGPPPRSDDQQPPRLKLWRWK